MRGLVFGARMFCARLMICANSLSMLGAMRGMKSDVSCASWAHSLASSSFVASSCIERYLSAVCMRFVIGRIFSLNSALFSSFFSLCIV